MLYLSHHINNQEKDKGVIKKVLLESLIRI